MGMQADVISANRKLLEDIQFRTKKLEFALLNPDGSKKESIMSSDRTGDSVSYKKEAAVTKEKNEK